jgi:hypothetical protein
MIEAAWSHRGANSFERRCSGTGHVAWHDYELQLGKRPDKVAVDRGREDEVEAGEGLDDSERPKVSAVFMRELSRTMISSMRG